MFFCGFSIRQKVGSVFIIVIPTISKSSKTAEFSSVFEFKRISPNHMAMEITKRSADFLGGIKKTDGIVIIYNNDGDGISACALMMKFLEKSDHKKPYIISQPMPMDKNLTQRVKTGIPHKIIFLDMAADQQENIVKQMRGLGDVLIVDHHQVHKNLNSGHTNDSKPVVVHYNPRMNNSNTYQSTSYCIYKICSKLMDMEDCLWIAGVGMVADYNLNDSKDIVKALRDKYGFTEEKLYDTKLGRIADMISATSATKALSYEQMVGVMMNADLDDFEKAPHADKMVESNEIIRHEMQILTEDAESTMERSGKVLIYNMKSKYNLSSPLSTKLSEKYPKNLLVIYQVAGNRLKISSRNQAKNVNAARVMERAAKSVGGSGGGHDAAAGATIPRDKWEEFKETMIKMANKTE